MGSSRRTVLAGVALIVAAGCATAGALLLAHPHGAGGAPSVAGTPLPRPKATPTVSSPSTAFTATRITTIGDSIMAGYGLPDGQAWPELIAARDGVAIENLGCSGAGFIAVGGCGTAFSGLVGQAATDPQLIIIESSDNDLDADPAQLAAATSATLTAIRHRFPSAAIVAVGTLWDQPGAVPDEVASSSADLQAAAAAVGGSFIDLGQPLRGRPGLLQADSEHPTAAGQQALANAVTQALAAVGVRI